MFKVEFDQNQMMQICISVNFFTQNWTQCMDILIATFWISNIATAYGFLFILKSHTYEFYHCLHNLWSLYLQNTLHGDFIYAGNPLIMKCFGVLPIVFFIISNSVSALC